MVFFFCMIIDIMNYEYFHYTCVVFVLPVVCSLEYSGFLPQSTVAGFNGLFLCQLGPATLCWITRRNPMDAESALNQSNCLMCRWLQFAQKMFSVSFTWWAVSTVFVLLLVNWMAGIAFMDLLYPKLWRPSGPTEQHRWDKASCLCSVSRNWRLLFLLVRGFTKERNKYRQL